MDPPAVPHVPDVSDVSISRDYDPQTERQETTDHSHFLHCCYLITGVALTV